MDEMGNVEHDWEWCNWTQGYNAKTFSGDRKRSQLLKIFLPTGRVGYYYQGENRGRPFEIFAEAVEQFVITENQGSEKFIHRVKIHLIDGYFCDGNGTIPMHIRQMHCILVQGLKTYITYNKFNYATYHLDKSATNLVVTIIKGCANLISINHPIPRNEKAKIRQIYDFTDAKYFYSARSFEILMNPGDLRTP
jgi:hypothetical protein